MAKQQFNPHIKIDDDYFIPEKTNDVYKEVEFLYGDKVWQGVLPKFLEKQGLDLTDEDFERLLDENYALINPNNRKNWIQISDTNWEDKSSATYKVLAALHSGKWECRVCGPVPKVNPQAASRLRDLKKRGYVIGSKRKDCLVCNQKTMHDILVMLPMIEAKFEHGNELRKPMSDGLKKRIKQVLGYKEVCFNVIRTEVELLIDHKFPSQRWNQPESDNLNNMSEKDINAKFQLLSNQTNMWKSRYCDNCVKNGVRGDFMGLRWYHLGNETWQGKTQYDENGCLGCPWYDLEEWKNKLLAKIQK